METMDKDLCELFFGVMKEHLIDFMCSENIKQVKKTLPEIRRKYKGKKLKREGYVRSFPSIGNLMLTSQMENVAHFYEYSTCLASTTAESFFELIKGNLEFFRIKVQRKTVIICCIAGVIASEMVAVVKTLCHCMKDCMQEFLHFQLAFINADDKWNSVIESVLRELNAEVKVKYKIKLTHRTIQSQNRQEALDVLLSSDVLIATKFSAEVSNMKDKHFRQLLEVALKHMKSDSLFFFIDSSAAAIINDLQKGISKFGYFQRVYKKACDYHCLSLDSVEHHLKRYNEYFGVDLSSSYCFFSACAWLKSEKRSDSKTEHASASNATQNQMKKDKKTARKKAYWFRRSVEILTCHEYK